MKTRLFFLAFFGLLLGLQAQRYDFSAPEAGAKRTYPVDSCLWFQIPTDFIVRGTFTLGGGASTGVNISFSTTTVTGGVIRGRGRFAVAGDQFPVPGWNWASGQEGKIELIVPNNSSGSGGPGSDPLGDFINFPILISGFLLGIEENTLATPFPVNFQLTALESEL